jgi:predicted hotdog family 3-hydroxylacyl-ACP dehydratase
MIDRAWIEARIPHQGDMCLLERVAQWDEQHIVCHTTSHALQNNPLRADESLGIANAIEYAAQAMAVHGALLAGDGEAPKSGYLTSVRDVRWQRAAFDAVSGELTVRAERLSGNEVNVLYTFEVSGAGEVLIGGRASVMLNAAAAGE